MRAAGQLDVERLRPLCLAGFMGAGKSAVGEQIANDLGAPFIDLDLMIESIRGETVADVFAHLGESGFRVLELQLLPIALRPGAVVALGGGTLSRHEAAGLVEREAFGVWLDAPFDVLRQRLLSSSLRPLANRLGEAELRALYERRRPGYAALATRVDASQPLPVVVDEVRRLWTA